MIRLYPLRLHYKTLWRGILGIALETILVGFFLLVGFAVSVFWWKIIK